jgi:hypothetical protein
MKVFLSWSGEVSHKVALILRDWLPSVIQDVVPYVSSEDIDKGTRWSSDIAGELEESSFGILCVTKGNLDAPWLCFEAGALSKTIDKSNVSPFLFNIKRSEVSGPILQFQSTIFEKNDVFKLVSSVYAKSNNNLNEDRLKRTFDMWWPSLQEKMGGIKESPPQPQLDQPEEIDTSQILEEILELSRNNQRLLRDPDVSLREQIQELQIVTEKMAHERARIMHERASRPNSPISSELMSSLKNIQENRGAIGSFLYLQVLFSLSRDRFPWVYDSGMDLIRALKSQTTNSVETDKEFEDFLEILMFTFQDGAFGSRSISKSDHTFFNEYVLIVEYELHSLRQGLV